MNNTINIAKILYQTYLKDRTVLTQTGEISVSLLHQLLHVKRYHALFMELCHNQIQEIVFQVEDSSDKIILYKADIISGIHKLVNRKELELTTLENQELERLESQMQMAQFLNKYQHKMFEITIEGHRYSISTDEMLSFLNQTSTTFYENYQDNRSILGISKDYFAFALYHLIQDGRLLEDYLLSSDMMNNIEMIREMQIRDIEWINQIPETINPYQKQVHISDSLKA